MRRIRIQRITRKGIDENPVVITALLVIIMASKISWISAILLVPYLLWTGFSTCFN
ncbi:tryptophan-rich sensory protein [Metabacillus sp. RGM 3146]|uniref:tryptophan-rich sensory protein n=1 Tax=Metabacillus sp. RGM 3146 TaxID=3401092 RepID=UPI003B9D0295